MKACTDACLFGAWVAAKVLCFQFPVSSCLDIGTGTGLLSLMLVQMNTDVFIDAVEIDEAAALQASENFKSSSWQERLNVYTDSIQHFATSTNKKYDVIICNPPFYEHDLKSLNQQRNIALHSNKLSLEELVFYIDKLLADDGYFFVLLPYHRTNYFEELLLKNKLHIKEKVSIKQTPKHNYFRTIFWVDRKSVTVLQSEIIIMNEENEYSSKFKELLKDYYLKLS